MIKKACLLTRPFLAEDIEYLKSGIGDSMDFIVPSDFSSDGLINCIKNNSIEIFLGTVPPADVIMAANKLKLIQIPWTGLDNIKFEGLNSDIESKISICNSHSNAKSVAELAVGLMLSTIKWIPLHDRSLRNNDWRRPGGNSRFYPPVLLSGKNIGLLGFGHIGYEIVKMLKGFNLNFHAVSKTGIDRFNSGIEISDVSKKEQLFKNSDILFVTIPLTTETANMIGKSDFELMKKDSVVINVSRGGVINEEAFYNALKDEIISAAAIDVWYNYPKRGESDAVPSRFNFCELDNAVLSPHRGGFAKENLPHLDDVIVNLQNYISGKELINKIDIKNLY